MSDRLERTELIELVRKIADSEGGEVEVDDWIEILEANVPHPGVVDLIFFAEPELSPEEIVEMALQYKGIELPGSQRE